MPEQTQALEEAATQLQAMQRGRLGRVAFEEKRSVAGWDQWAAY